MIDNKGIPAAYGRELGIDALRQVFEYLFDPSSDHSMIIKKCFPGGFDKSKLKTPRYTSNSTYHYGTINQTYMDNGVYIRVTVIPALTYNYRFSNEFRVRITIADSNLAKLLKNHTLMYLSVGEAGSKWANFDENQFKQLFRDTFIRKLFPAQAPQSCKNFVARMQSFQEYKQALSKY